MYRAIHLATSMLTVRVEDSVAVRESRCIDALEAAEHEHTQGTMGLSDSVSLGANGFFCCFVCPSGLDGLHF